MEIDIVELTDTIFISTVENEYSKDRQGLFFVNKNISVVSLISYKFDITISLTRSMAYAL